MTTLEQQLRHTLHTVARSVDESDFAPAGAPDPERTPARPRRRRGRWVALGLGVAAVPLVAAAGAQLGSGPEYVDTIDPDRIVVEGSIDGSRWLMVESDRTDGCGKPVTGVEIVEERENLIGSEWSTVGSSYGEPEQECGGTDPAPWLADPSRYEDGGSQVGDSFLWTWAVHPSVTAVRVTVDGDVEDLPVYRVDGAGYAVYEVPSGLRSYTAELVAGDEVVPGTLEEQTVPRR